MTKIQQTVSPLIIFLLGFTVAASFHLYIASLPGISFGFWPQSEIAILGLHFFGAICSFLLLLLHFFGNLPNRFFFNPPVLILFALGCFSLFLTPLQDLPLRHILGSVRIGEGVIWWFDIFSLSLSSVILMHFKFWRRFLFVSFLLAFVITYGMLMGFRQFHSYFSPLYFEDFLAFHIIALLGAILFFFKKNNSLFLVILVFIAANILMYFTQNRIGIAFSLLGLAFYIILWKVPVFSYPVRNKFSQLTVLSIPFLVLVGFAGFTIFSSDKNFYDFYANWQMNVVSRIYLIEVVYQPLVQSPLSLLTGLGWGTYVEHLSQYLPAWLDFTRTSRQWDGILTDHFHTHNIFVEALYSTGIIGALLLYLYCFSIYFYTPRKYKLAAASYAGALVSLGSFWFILSLNLPFLIFTTSLLTRFRRYNRPACFSPKFTKVAIGIIFVLCAALQGWGAYVAYQTAVANNSYEALSLNAEDLENNECPMFYNDYGAGGFHLSKIISDRARFITNLSEKDETAFKDVSKEELVHRHILEFNHIFCQGLNYQEQYPSSKRLQLATLISRGELLIGLEEYLSPEEKAYYYSGWEKELRDWLKDVPQRPDLAVPFFLWHVGQNQDEKIAPLVETLFQNDPTNPVALWFKGLLLIEDPDNVQRGLVMMRRALENGIERFMPVDDELKAALGMPITAN